MLLTKVKTNHYKKQAFGVIDRCIKVDVQLMRDEIDFMKRLKKEGNDIDFKIYEQSTIAKINFIYYRLIELLDLGAEVQMAEMFTANDYDAILRSILHR